MGIQRKAKLVAIVDDDDSIRSALKGLLKSAELAAESFASAEEFLKSSQHHGAACLITDIRMPGMSGLAGLDLLRHGRLRQQQFFGSTTKVQVSGNRPKDFKSEVLH